MCSSRNVVFNRAQGIEEHSEACLAAALHRLAAALHRGFRLKQVEFVIDSYRSAKGNAGPYEIDLCHSVLFGLVSSPVGPANRDYFP